MKWFWEQAQRISWKCHSHSVQIIDFGVVIKATQLLSCQMSLSKLKQNGFTNLFSYCTARVKERLCEVRGKAEAGVVGCNAHPTKPTPCLHVYKRTHIDTLGYTQHQAAETEYFEPSLAQHLVQMKMERACSFCLEMLWPSIPACAHRPSQTRR